MPRITYLPVVLFTLLLAHAARADNWPQWRGPRNDGISKETGLPTEWSPTKNVAWTLKMPGRGSSTPAVWGDRLFLTCEHGADLVVLCISTAGKELWKNKLGPARGAGGGEANGASPSPSTDGKHVFAFMGNGELACYDFDGNEAWKVNTQERYGKFRLGFGYHTTPVLDGDRLYLQFIHDGGGFVVALDSRDGKEVWRVKRDSDGTAENKHSYASPTLWRNGKEAYLITHGNDYAIAHRLSDGQEIWRVGGLNPKSKYDATLRFVSSPVATPDLIVVPSAKNHGVVGLKPDAKGLVMPGSDAEAWRLFKGTPDVTSPLNYDGLIYLCGDGSLSCLDARTGKEQFNHRIHASAYRASPVAADGHVYLTARDGVVTVIKAGPKFEPIAENRLPDSLYASPAISNGRIYLRGFGTLYAIGETAR